MKNCSYCGRINDDDALFCCKCGRAFNENEVKTFNPIADAMMHYDEVVASPKQKRLCCPKCKSNHLQARFAQGTVPCVVCTGDGSLCFTAALHSDSYFI